MFILPLLFSYKVIPTYNAFFIFFKIIPFDVHQREKS